MNFSVRLMNNNDISEVAVIERQAFPTMWPPIPFKKELDNKLDDFYKAMNWEKPSPNLKKASQFFGF